MLQPIFSASDGHSKNKLSNSVKELVESWLVIPKAVANKSYKFSVFCLFVFLFAKHFQNLRIARSLDLAQELNASRECSFLDERMSQNVFRFAIDSIQIVMIFLIYFDIFFIIMHPPFYCWRDLFA